MTNITRAKLVSRVRKVPYLEITDGHKGRARYYTVRNRITKQELFVNTGRGSFGCASAVDTVAEVDQKIKSLEVSPSEAIDFFENVITVRTEILDEAKKQLCYEAASNDLAALRFIDITAKTVAKCAIAIRAAKYDLTTMYKIRATSN